VSFWRSRRPLIALALAASLIAAFAVACGADEEKETPALEYRGDAIANPWDKPDFTLTDTEGNPFDFRKETDGRVTALYFGYTHCPDICPTHMADLASALSAHPDLGRQVQVVFVTVDPARDDAERLRAFLDAFDEDFIGLYGTPAQVDAASQDALGDLWRPFATYVTHGNDYTVSHPAFVIGYGTDNKAHVLWQLNTRTADYANDMQLLINEGRES
jgi:protein SCO1/2